MDDIYILNCDGPIVPKTRPRVRKDGRAYMPENYVNWKAATIRSFRLQRIELQIPKIHYPSRIYVLLRGRHNRSGDMVDNIPGAICDALVQSRILIDDNAKQAPGAIYELKWSKDPPTGFIAIAPWLNLADSQQQIKEILTHCKH